MLVQPTVNGLRKLNGEAEELEQKEIGRKLDLWLFEAALQCYGPEEAHAALNAL